MLRIAVLAGTAVLAIGTACPICAQTVYQCVPDEPRAAAPDRLVSVEITLKPNGEFASVVYRAANGAAYDRSKQYETENHQDESGKYYWSGTLRMNRNVGMVGSIYQLGNRLIYIETATTNSSAARSFLRLSRYAVASRSQLKQSRLKHPPRRRLPSLIPTPKSCCRLQYQRQPRIIPRFCFLGQQTIKRSWGALIVANTILGQSVINIA